MEVVADLGLRGVDADNPDKHIIHRGRYKSLSPQQRAGCAGARRWSRPSGI
jgi:hypothetical protein